MHIDTLLHSVKQQFKLSNRDINLSVTSSWAQGRTLYGGVSAALVYQAMREAVADDNVLRSLNTNFIAPIESDCEFNINVEVLRQGKNVTQVIGRLIQNNQVAVMSQASFGVARQSSIQITSNLQHTMDYPQRSNVMPPPLKLAPSFLKHFNLIPTKGGLPFYGLKEGDVHGWMRFNQPPSDFTDAHLVALIDIWPPTVLQMLKVPAMASTMSWNLEFIHPHQKIAGEDWFAYQAQTRQAVDGYAHTEANIWDKHGELVAISRQVVAVFA
ncbi:thioesterase family protein [uncultured Paraglaciecola sp.]|uniref:acyl-CoA thioesterase n=1 Tax=uncultured Paraglaciecola sp. TaxID=1765024 RepID=UPI002616E195|nr:thioesterase family protein [uncultured Paraglaciecola sp.]